MFDDFERDRLKFIIGSYIPAKNAFLKIKSFMMTNSHFVKWKNVSKSVSKILTNYTGTKCKIYFCPNDDFTFYDIVVHGAATVPDEYNCESDLDIYVDMSKDLFSNSLTLSDSFFEEFEKLFILTFIHELTHTTQYDDDINYDGSTKLKYLSNPLEMDAYSMELACNMRLYNEKRTYCESYYRYNMLKDRKVFREFVEMTLEKFEFLKSINI